MSRSVGLAYAVTGAAVASALIAITASTTGFFEGARATTTDAAASASAQVAPNAAGLGTTSAGGGVTVAPAGEGVQYVYVDEPAPTRRASERGRERFEHRYEEEEDDD